MRISDWSSDVCSSDLLYRRTAIDPHLFRQRNEQVEMRAEPGAVGRDIAFDHQRRYRDREAASDGRHSMIVADLHIVEKHFVDVAVAARQPDRDRKSTRMKSSH